jgi:hypothetical protein
MSSETQHRAQLVPFIDDSAFSLREKAIERLLREFAFNARHIRSALMLVAQTLRSISPAVRKSCSHVLAFQPANRLESSTLVMEFLCLDPQSASTLFSQAYKQRHGHLLTHVDSRRAFSNWDEVLLPRS